MKNRPKTSLCLPVLGVPGVSAVGNSKKKTHRNDGGGGVMGNFEFHCKKVLSKNRTSAQSSYTSDLN